MRYFAPKFMVRHDGCVAGWDWYAGLTGWFVVCGRTGRNVTADILDPFLPDASPHRGARRVSERQARFLTMIANDPAGTQDYQDIIRDKLRRSST